ncbi:MAG TPA: OmpH family outer membrane protein [bacterium]|nr:OmpH family outer membrane protein [bacterium]
MRFIALLCCFLVASLATAADFKIGTVDMQKLFNNYPGTKAAKTKLQAFEKKKSDDLADSAQEIKDLKSELDKSGSVLSDKQKAKKKRELDEKIQAYQQDSAQAEKELMSKQNDMTQAVVDEIKALVANIAKDNGLDMVLDQDKTVYLKNSVDLTDKVLKTFKKDSSDDSK